MQDYRPLDILRVVKLQGQASTAIFKSRLNANTTKCPLEKIASTATIEANIFLYFAAARAGSCSNWHERNRAYATWSVPAIDRLVYGIDPIGGRP